jgi:hypothetical protein
VTRHPLAIAILLPLACTAGPDHPYATAIALSVQVHLADPPAPDELRPSVGWALRAIPYCYPAPLPSTPGPIPPSGVRAGALRSGGAVGARSHQQRQPRVGLPQSRLARFFAALGVAAGRAGDRAVRGEWVSPGGTWPGRSCPPPSCRSAPTDRSCSPARGVLAGAHHLRSGRPRRGRRADRSNDRASPAPAGTESCPARRGRVEAEQAGLLSSCGVRCRSPTPAPGSASIRPSCCGWSADGTRFYYFVGAEDGVRLRSVPSAAGRHRRAGPGTRRRCWTSPPAATSTSGPRTAADAILRGHPQPDGTLQMQRPARSVPAGLSRRTLGRRRSAGPQGLIVSVHDPRRERRG